MKFRRSKMDCAARNLLLKLSVAFGVSCSCMSCCGDIMISPNRGFSSMPLLRGSSCVNSFFCHSLFLKGYELRIFML